MGFIKFIQQQNFSTKCMSYFLFCISIYVLIHICVLTNGLRYPGDWSSVLSYLYTTEDTGTMSKNMKYILNWNKYYLINTEKNKETFPRLNCAVKNCVFSDDRNLLGDYTNFDAIIFCEEDLVMKNRPQKRTNSQIYIFTTIESSYNKPACELFTDGFFNWTFTHRLDSDVLWNYFVVRNREGEVIAPSVDVVWQRSSEPVSQGIKAILRSKRKAAAWLVSHCSADSLRDDYLSRLQEHLFHYSLRIDVYGECTNKRCTNDNCEEMLLNEYFFYMAFENSFAEDYVTEKVLHGYNNLAVPIVYGGANYSRFLPDGSYINARYTHPYNLAYKIYQAMTDPSLYETYFKWTNLYSVDSDARIYHPLCDLCAALNSEKALNAPAKSNFRLWWNGQNGMKWCLPDEFWNETAKINVDGKHIFDLY